MTVNGALNSFPFTTDRIMHKCCPKETEEPKNERAIINVFSACIYLCGQKADIGVP
jgi:hypothetical protein